MAEQKTLLRTHPQNSGWLMLVILVGCGKQPVPLSLPTWGYSLSARFGLTIFFSTHADRVSRQWLTSTCTSGEPEHVIWVHSCFKCAEIAYGVKPWQNGTKEIFARPLATLNVAHQDWTEIRDLRSKRVSTISVLMGKAEECLTSCKYVYWHFRP
jgi:hypothetical protein